MSNMHDLSVTIITHSFPSEHFPVSGIFVQDNADYLSDHVGVKVISPKPKTNYLLAIIKKKWQYYRDIPMLASRKKYNIIRPEFLTYPRNYFYWRVKKSFWRAIEGHLTEDSDIFHVHFLYPGGSIIPKIREKFPNKRIFLTIHGNDWHLYKNDKKLRKTIRDSFESVDKILTVSNSLREDIIRVFPEHAEKITVIYNGVDTGNMKLIRSNNTFISDKKIKILMVGAFVEGKGVHVLLKALNSINADEMETVVIGNMIDKKVYQDILKLRNNLGLKEQVKFLVSCPREKVYQYMNDCDYFILPSLKEGFGIALVEALLYGKPVISTFSGGPEEIVTKENGLLVPPGDINGLKEAINKMNKIYINYSSLEIAEDAQKRFGTKNITNELLNEYYKATHEC
jgi:glycosyltransferase involved in cell wall biosynthesis